MLTFSDRLRKRRTKWLLVLGAALLCVGGVLWWLERCPSDLGTLVELEGSHSGGMTVGDSGWELKMDASGIGTVATWDGGKAPRRFTAAPRGLREFQKALTEYRLCDLPAQIGHRVPDSSWDRMRIKTTTLDKTIVISYVDPEHRHDRDVICAQRLWELVYGFTFSPPPAPGK
jgi:hypothetical protein